MPEPILLSVPHQEIKIGDAVFDLHPLPGYFAFEKSKKERQLRELCDGKTTFSTDEEQQVLQLSHDIICIILFPEAYDDESPLSTPEERSTQKELRRRADKWMRKNLTQSLLLKINKIQNQLDLELGND